MVKLNKFRIPILLSLIALIVAFTFLAHQAMMPLGECTFGLASCCISLPSIFTLQLLPGLAVILVQDRLIPGIEIPFRLERPPKS